MAQKFDLIVIGTGVAAGTVAERCRKEGWTVAVIDCRPFGGTCALRGCDPKKVLVGAAAALEGVEHLSGKGLVKGTAHIDWPALMAFKRSFTDPVPERRAKNYAEQGIATYRGHARFTGPNRLTVDGDAIEATRIVIASGAEPVPLDIPGVEHLAASDDFLALENLPKHIVMVGGGYIAAEFSCLAAIAGARVTVLQRGGQMLKHFEPELVGLLMKQFTTLGIEVKLGTEVRAIGRSGNSYIVRAERDGEEIAIDADFVVHAAGRIPALKSLDLEAGGIATSKGRLQLNEHLQSTSNPAVYAAGDAAQKGPPLTPVSARDGRIVARNLINGNTHKPDYRGVPSVAFTLPPIASVGLSERAAREQGLKYRRKLEDAASWYTATQRGGTTYGFKTLVEEETGRILGAHIVGPHADEVINLFALAIREGLSADALKWAFYSYPTATSDIGYML